MISLGTKTDFNIAVDQKSLWYNLDCVWVSKLKRTTLNRKPRQNIYAWNIINI